MNWSDEGFLINKNRYNENSLIAELFTKEKFKLPVFAYQVSGEYSLIETAITKKLINKDAIYESLVAFKRAGAKIINFYIFFNQKIRYIFFFI